jgi:AraC-like DNA-binding protein
MGTLDTDALAGLIERQMGRDGAHETAVEGLTLVRASKPSQPIPIVQEPSLCLIARGCKQMMVADALFRYDSSRCLLVTVGLPMAGQVVEATPRHPYLSLRLGIDAAQISSLITEAGGAAGNAGDREARPPWGISVGCVESDLLEAATRLVRLLDMPERIPILAPLIRREILYLLLVGEQGAALRRIARADPELQAVLGALYRLKHGFAEPLRVDALAREAGMSRSRFHLHFRAVTTLSPLQYQKRLRLQEARRLMLGGAVDAATACYQVGYESPSQFSREYRRLFGEAPHRDMARLRGDA